jgi:hypothetical protein
MEASGIVAVLLDASNVEVMAPRQTISRVVRAHAPGIEGSVICICCITERVIERER